MQPTSQTGGELYQTATFFQPERRLRSPVVTANSYRLECRLGGKAREQSAKQLAEQQLSQSTALRITVTQHLSPDQRQPKELSSFIRPEINSSSNRMSLREVKDVQQQQHASQSRMITISSMKRGSAAETSDSTAASSRTKSSNSPKSRHSSHRRAPILLPLSLNTKTDIATTLGRGTRSQTAGEGSDISSTRGGGGVEGPTANEEFWKKVNEIVKNQPRKQTKTAAATGQRHISSPQVLPGISSTTSSGGSKILLPLLPPTQAVRQIYEVASPSTWFSSATTTPAKDLNDRKSPTCNLPQGQANIVQSRSPASIANSHYLSSSKQHTTSTTTTFSQSSSRRKPPPANSTAFKSFKRIFPSNDSPHSFNDSRVVVQPADSEVTSTSHSTKKEVYSSRPSLQTLRQPSRPFVTNITNMLSASSCRVQQETTYYQASRSSVPIGGGISGRNGLNLYFANKVQRESLEQTISDKQPYFSPRQALQSQDEGQVKQQYSLSGIDHSTQSSSAKKTVAVIFRKNAQTQDSQRPKKAAAAEAMRTNNKTSSSQERGGGGVAGGLRPYGLDLSPNHHVEKVDSYQLLQCSEKLEESLSSSQVRRLTSAGRTQQARRTSESEEISEVLDFSFSEDKTQTTQTSSSQVRDQSNSSTSNEHSKINFLASQQHIKRLNLRSKQQDNLVRKLFKIEPTITRNLQSE